MACNHNSFQKIVCFQAYAEKKQEKEVTLKPRATIKTCSGTGVVFIVPNGLLLPKLSQLCNSNRYYNLMVQIKVCLQISQQLIPTSEFRDAISLGNEPLEFRKQKRNC